MRRWLWLAALALGACGDGGEGAAAQGGDSAVADAAMADAAAADDMADSAVPDAQAPDVGVFPDDLEMTADDFDCILEWSKVRRFYVTNKLGRLDETLAVANNPEGGTYPPGTVIQLVPQEAMVKRAEGWNPETNDWEFFALEVGQGGSVEIIARGAEDTVNAFGGNCMACHSKAAPQWDLVCEQDHGCDLLPFGPDVIEALQQADARCP